MSITLLFWLVEKHWEFNIHSIGIKILTLLPFNYISNGSKLECKIGVKDFKRILRR